MPTVGYIIMNVFVPHLRNANFQASDRMKYHMLQTPGYTYITDFSNSSQPPVPSRIISGAFAFFRHGIADPPPSLNLYIGSWKEPAYIRVNYKTYLAHCLEFLLTHRPFCAVKVPYTLQQYFFLQNQVSITFPRVLWHPVIRKRRWLWQISTCDTTS